MRLTLPEVFDLSKAALIGVGTSPRNAESVADSIREAEADGIRNVGLAYLPFYCEHVLCGKVDGAAEPMVQETSASAVMVDARCGFAHPAYRTGEAALLERARQSGLAGLGVTNAYANGVVGYFVDRIARAGLLGLAVTNSSAAVAPWGGTKPFFGTNPIAFGIPRADQPPTIVDQSTSATAFVNLAQAAANDEAIPSSWALDPSGTPTSDPHEALRGSLQPIAGYKGSNLALMVEVLAAGLTGAQWSFEASSLGTNDGGPPRLGQFYLAIDPQRFGGVDFANRIEVLLEAMASQDGVRLPGDRRLKARRKAEAEGVELETELYETLSSYAEAAS